MRTLNESYRLKAKKTQHYNVLNFTEFCLGKQSLVDQLSTIRVNAL